MKSLSLSTLLFLFSISANSQNINFGAGLNYSQNSYGSNFRAGAGLSVFGGAGGYGNRGYSSYDPRFSLNGYSQNNYGYNSGGPRGIFTGNYSGNRRYNPMSAYTRYTPRWNPPMYSGQMRTPYQQNLPFRMGMQFPWMQQNQQQCISGREWCCSRSHIVKKTRRTSRSRRTRRDRDRPSRDSGGNVDIIPDDGKPGKICKDGEKTEDCVEPTPKPDPIDGGNPDEICPVDTPPEDCVKPKPDPKPCQKDGEETEDCVEPKPTPGSPNPGKRTKCTYGVVKDDSGRAIRCEEKDEFCERMAKQGGHKPKECREEDVPATPSPADEPGKVTTTPLEDPTSGNGDGETSDPVTPGDGSIPTPPTKPTPTDPVIPDPVEEPDDPVVVTPTPEEPKPKPEKPRSCDEVISRRDKIEAGAEECNDAECIKKRNEKNFKDIVVSVGGDPVIGARQAMAAIYGSCEAVTRGPFNPECGSLGVEKKKDKSGKIIARVIKDKGEYISKHFYLRGMTGADYEPKSCNVLDKPPGFLMDQGVVKSDADSIDLRNLPSYKGSGHEYKGIDCLDFLCTAMAAAGMKMGNGKSFKNCLDTGTAKGGQGGKGILGEITSGKNECLKPVSFGKKEGIKAGDVVIMNGHSFMIDAVGDDPFGLDKLSQKGSSKSVNDLCQNVKTANYNFNTIQSGAEENLGVARFKVKDTIRSSSTIYHAGLREMGVRACIAKFGNKAEQALVTKGNNSMVVARHQKENSNCMMEPMKIKGSECTGDCKAIEGSQKLDENGDAR